MNMELVNEKVDRLSKEIFQELGGIKKDVADLKTSISFTQTTLEEKVRKVEERIKNTLCMEQSLSGNSDIEFIKDKMNDLENRSRRNNIRVDGLIEADKETWKESEERLQDVIKESLGIKTEILIDRAHRVGDKAKTRERNRHRTIVARLHNYKDKEIIFNQARIVKLSSMGIYISEDFSEITRQRRYQIDKTRKLMRQKGEYAVIRGVDRLDTVAPKGWVNKIMEPNGNILT